MPSHVDVRNTGARTRNLFSTTESYRANVFLEINVITHRITPAIEQVPASTMVH